MIILFLPKISILMQRSGVEKFTLQSLSKIAGASKPKDLSTPKGRYRVDAVALAKSK
jgi:hypothetical protein